jgi:DNA-binding MarR family transcriptional regulator
VEINTATLLLRIYQGFERHLIGALRERGHPGFRAKYSGVLVNIDATGTRLSTLAERAGITKPSMVELVDELESKSYVRREPDPDDQRAKLIVPTELGMNAISLVRGAIDDLEQRFREVLGAQRYDAVRSALAELQGQFGPKSEGPQPRAR